MNSTLMTFWRLRTRKSKTRRLRRSLQRVEANYIKGKRAGAEAEDETRDPPRVGTREGRGVEIVGPEIETARTDGDLARGTDTGDPGPATNTGDLDPATGVSSGGGAGAEAGGGRVGTETAVTEEEPP